MQITPHFSLADLTKTSRNVPNNVPENFMGNIEALAWLLEDMYTQIGPFEIISAFRSEELQQLLATEGEPTGKGKSFHVVGLGADIYPTTMGIKEYFGKLIASPLRDQFAELFLKEPQNAIHIGYNYDGRNPMIKALNQAGEYVALSWDEIQDFAAPYMESVAELYEQVATPKTAKTLMLIGAAALLIAYGVSAYNTRHSKVVGGWI